LHRDGKLYTQEAIEVYDHDFPYLADGVAIPHGIYDVQLNTAYINIGISHDTCDFSCDSMKRWWNFRGRYDYPDASSILVLVDCGGSNGYRHYVFKRAIQQLADAIGIEICIALISQPKIPPTVKKLQKDLTGFLTEKYTFLFSTYNRLLQCLTLRYPVHSNGAQHRVQKN